MKLIILGSGSCVPQRDRSSTSLLIETDEVVYLLDCGGSTPHQIPRAGYELNDIDVILLSHLHGDHMLGMPVLLKSMELLGRKKELPIYGPAGTQKIITDITEVSYPGFFDPTPFDIEFHELTEENSIIKIDNKLSAASTKHGTPSYAFRINDAVTYTGDASPSESIIKIARGCNTLVHDSSVTSDLEEIANKHGHSSARQAGIHAREANVRRLVLVHVEFWYRGKDQKLINDAQTEFDGEIVVGTDLMEILI